MADSKTDDPMGIPQGTLALEARMDGRFDIRAPTNVPYAKALLFSNGGAPIDMTGWSMVGMKLRDQPGGTLRLALSPTPTANGSSIAIATPVTLGLVNLVISAADLAALPVGFPGLLSYDLVMTDNLSVTRRFMWGSFIYFPGVTY
jgi:hypothetical protein